MPFVYGVGICATIANAWFFMSAIGTDLLWLRFYLFAAYVFLFAAALTNFPPWGTWDRVSPDLWLLGAILWPFFVGLIHLHGMLRLVWEERRVSLRTEDDEALWRLVFRRSGMGRLEFKQALELGRWRSFKRGDIIFDTQGKTASSATSLHMMVEGVAVLTASRKDGTSATSSLYSGYIFNLAVCNAFGVYIGLERAPIEKVEAQTDCLLYEWDFLAVKRMAGESCVALAAAWRNLVLYNVGAAFSATCGDIYASNGDSEVPDFFEGARSRDLVEPLTKEELPPFNTWKWLTWFVKMHNPNPPLGLRHNSMPSSGMLARGRLLAAKSVGERTPSQGNTRLILSCPEKLASVV